MAHILLRLLLDTFKTKGYLDIHTYAASIRKEIGIREQHRAGIKQTYHIAFMAIVSSIKNNLIYQLGKGAEQYDMKTGELRKVGNKYKINDAIYTKLSKIVILTRILSKISIYPKTLHHRPTRSDPLLASQNKVNQINKLNAVKLTIRPTYTQ
jgi:hypothetical protein